MDRYRPQTTTAGRRLARVAALLGVTALMGCVASSASAAGSAAYRTPGYRGTSKPVPTVPAALPTPVTLSPSGRFPDVMVDGAGTSHIVWVSSDGVNADAVHYCRLPRGASACDSSQTLVPVKDYGDGDDPSFNVSTDGARIVQVGQQIVILDYRYPTVYPKPDGSTVSTTVLEWVSEDGGASFTGPGLVGSQPIGGGVVAFGPPNDPQILSATDGVTGGTYVQTLVPGQFTSLSVNLGDGGPDQAYSGSLALDGGLPVAAFADLHNQTLIRRLTDAGSGITPSTWGPPLTVAGDEPKLAGGPGGLFVMNRPAPNGPYTVRPITGAQAGPPVTVSGTDDPQYRDLTETSSGGLVSGWESRGGALPGVRVRSSPDGAGWSGTDRLIDGVGNGQLRVGSAGDGGGVAVLNHTGGINGAGQIVAIAYGKRTPTGVPGIAGVPGGGDPAATTTCQQVAFGVVKISGQLGCFLHGSGAYANDVVSDGELDFNGLRIIPDPGVQIIVNAHEHTFDTTGDVRVIAEGAGLSVTLWHGEIHVKLPTAGAETDLFDFDMSKFAADLDGFPIAAKIDVKLTATGVRIPVDLKLPAVFGGITGHAELVADRARGLHVDNLAIAISNAPIGPLLGDFSITYASASDTWLGSGKLKFPPQGAGLVLSADVTFARGHFIKGDIDIKPPGYGLPVFTDLYIDDISGGLELEPDTVITAGVGIGVIPVGPPTSFVNTMQINGQIAVTIADPFRIAVHGDAALLGLQVANADLLFVSNGFLSLNGNFHFGIDPVISVDTNLAAAFDLPHKLFSAELTSDVTVFGFPLEEIGGIVSSNGFAVCGKIPVPIGGPVGPFMFGHHWGDSWLDASFGVGCDLSAFRVATSPSRAAARAAGTAGAAGLPVTLPHAATASLAVHGAGGAPAVVLTAPDGTQTSPVTGTLPEAVQAITAAGGPAAAAFAAPGDAVTGVLLRQPKAGTWHVAAQPGSPALASVAESHALPAPAVHASVLGQGHRLRLRYQLHPRPGMTVTFAESAGKLLHRLGSARGAAGTLSFAPADGPAGRRNIVALIAQDGIPRPSVVLTRYQAPGPVVPGNVRRVKLKVRGSTLTVSFNAAQNALSYRIRVTSTDGKRRLLLATARHRAAKITGLGPGAATTVSVTAYAANGRHGRAAVATATSPR